MWQGVWSLAWPLFAPLKNWIFCEHEVSKIKQAWSCTETNILYACTILPDAVRVKCGFMVLIINRRTLQKDSLWAFFTALEQLQVSGQEATIIVGAARRRWLEWSQNCKSILTSIPYFCMETGFRTYRKPILPQGNPIFQNNTGPLAGDYTTHVNYPPIAHTLKLSSRQIWKAHINASPAKNNI